VSADPGTNTSVRIDLNGEQRHVAVRPGEVLIETLRDRFDCTSVRGTCGIGMCGTCTVQLDGRAVSSCLLLTEQVDGRAVRTSEGLCSTGTLDEVQQAFVDRQAYQCSFCIPGMVMTLRALKDEEPDADAARAREALGGNLCRCGTYPWVLDAAVDLFDREETER
jgi:aerobic-type carbon monoxide dehydrogenase small subunit (CoxS/CutS family)